MSDHLNRDHDALSGDVQCFSACLARSGLSWLVIEHTNEYAELRFIGPFEGGEVVWHCTFVTLQAELNRLAQESPRAPDSLRNFIEIGEPNTSGVPIRVGLALSCIDPPAIEKMIHMVRLYKHLRRGRHEYGDPVTLC